MINSIENGGVNIVDVRSKISSLKAAWIIKWLEKLIWSVIASEFFKIE